jgi:hypothetical protein
MRAMEAADAEVHDARLERRAVVRRHRNAEIRDLRKVRLTKTERSGRCHERERNTDIPTSTKRIIVASVGAYGLTSNINQRYKCGWLRSDLEEEEL